MDKKRLMLMGGLMVVAFVLFTQVKKMATPQIVEVPAETTTAPVVDEVEYVDILVSTSEIPFGTRLNESHMRWKQWPADNVTADFISSADRPQAMSELSGGVVRSIIYENEPISDRKIVSGGSGLLASLIRPGMRAVTTRISVDTAAGGFIQPGDRVDIILTTQAPADPTQPNFRATQQLFTANTIFENVRVLAIDQTFSTSSDSGATVIGSTATFEMSQTDSEVLQQSAAQGDLTLTLRPISSSGAHTGTSHATVKRDKGNVSSVSVYRNGQSQTVAIRGQ